MDALLANPAVQSAAAPYLVALGLTVALMAWRICGLAVTAGTLVCVWLALGLDLTPLTATRRIVWLTLGAAFVGATVDLALRDRQLPHWPAAVAGALALGWVAYTALSHRDPPAAVALGAGMAAFTALVAWAFDRLHAQPVRAGAATLASGLTVGGAALLSASASLGQIGLALGAAGGAFLSVAMVRGPALPAGRSLTLPAGLLVGLLAAAAVILAQLPWYLTVLLAGAPLVAGLPFGRDLRPWQQAIAVSAAAIVPGAIAVALAWYAGAAGGAAASGY